MDCPFYAKEVIEGFKENKHDIYKLIGKGLYTKDIYIFEKEAEPLFGAEIDPLRDYILQKYKLHKDMYKIKFNEFQRVIQQWVEYVSSPKDEIAEEQQFERASQKSRAMSKVSIAQPLGSEIGSDEDSPLNEAKNKYK